LRNSGVSKGATLFRSGNSVAAMPLKLPEEFFPLLAFLGMGFAALSSGPSG
jgi:hypothetical protein